MARSRDPRTMMVGRRSLRPGEAPQAGIESGLADRASIAVVEQQLPFLLLDLAAQLRGAALAGAGRLAQIDEGVRVPRRLRAQERGVFGRIAGEARALCRPSASWIGWGPTRRNQYLALAKSPSRRCMMPCQ